MGFARVQRVVPGFVALLLVAAPGEPRADEPSRGEGIVVVARGGPVLVETSKGLEVVGLAPAASLFGLQDLRELRAGDRVRWVWRRTISGVRMAEELTVDPFVRFEPEYRMGEDELAGRLSAGRDQLVVDARSREHYRTGHIPGAMSLPHDAPEATLARLRPGDASDPIVVYAEDERSPAAHVLARRLLARGHRQVRILDGGIRRWVDVDRHLEVRAEDVARLLRARTPLLVVDTRPPAAAATVRPIDSVSVPPEAFRWQDFDGTRPLPTLLLAGASSSDRSATEIAERVRLLRSARSVRSALRILVLAGGFDAWARAGLPVERGGEPRSEFPFRKAAELEVAPAEFERLWVERGGTGTVLLDVRRMGESQEPWVLKITLEDLPGRLAEIPRDREVVAFCSIGERSRVAAELLRKNGHRARFLRASPGH